MESVYLHGSEDVSRATRTILVDLRSAGMSVGVGGKYCKACAEEIGSRIRESLPDEDLVNH